MTITENEYDALALPELSALMEALDSLDALNDSGVEAELAGDILTIEFSDSTKYVVNSHRAARQIWMAASLSAWHFDWDPDRKQWIAKKDGDELWQTLSRLIAKKLDRAITLVRA